MRMTRIDTAATQFGQLVFSAPYPSDLVDHGGGDGGLPKVGTFVRTISRSDLVAPDAEAGELGRPASHLLWGDATDLRAWAALHPGLWVRPRRDGAMERASGRDLPRSDVFTDGWRDE
jgi:hypothetical protein